MEFISKHPWILPLIIAAVVILTGLILDLAKVHSTPMTTGLLLAVGAFGGIAAGDWARKKKHDSDDNS
jgi:hydrogenase/urease accessory protein HupE